MISALAPYATLFRSLAIDVTAGDALVDPPVRVVLGGEVERLARAGQVVEVAAAHGLLDGGLDPGDVGVHRRPEGPRVDGIARRVAQESPPSSASATRRSIEAMSFCEVISRALARRFSCWAGRAV